MNTSAISQMQLLYNEHLRAANAKFPRIPASGANNRLTNNSESAQLACFQSLPRFTPAQTESVENTGFKNHAGHQQLAHFQYVTTHRVSSENARLITLLSTTLTHFAAVRPIE
jgi:hypothetical protein